MSRRPWPVLALTLALAASAARAQEKRDEPPPAAVLFGKRCGSCHTLGEGDRVGPDLLGVTARRDRAWIAGFVHGPGAAIDRGDPIATELFARFKNVRMPDQALTDDELNGLFAYFDDCTAKGGCKLVTGKTRPVSEATAQDVALGHALFEGTQPLANGGPACISCHNVRGVGWLGGGTLAKDLTFAFARLGEAGLTSGLESTPFPVMKDVFGRRPLTAGEVFALKAFLAGAATDGSSPQPDHDFFYLGVGGLFFALSLFGIAWPGRNRTVRRNALRRGRE